MKACLLLIVCTAAFLPPALAEIVYSGPLQVDTKNYFVSAVFPTEPKYTIDFDRNGTGEISFYNTGRIFTNVAYLQGNGTGRYNVDAAGESRALAGGTIIDGSGAWSAAARTVSTGFNPLVGGRPLLENTAYLGVQFSDLSGTYFGWVEIQSILTSVDGPWENHSIIRGWAYETTPNMPIVAGAIGANAIAVPEPALLPAFSVLTLLALAAWRLRGAVPTKRCEAKFSRVQKKSPPPMRRA